MTAAAGAREEVLRAGHNDAEELLSPGNRRSEETIRERQF